MILLQRSNSLALCLEKVKTGKTGQKDNNLKVQHLEFSLVNSTNTYRDLLCARPCARSRGFRGKRPRPALRSTAGHKNSSMLIAGGSAEEGH